MLGNGRCDNTVAITHLIQVCISSTVVVFKTDSSDSVLSIMLC